MEWTTCPVCDGAAEIDKNDVVYCSSLECSFMGHYDRSKLVIADHIIRGEN